MDRLFPLRTLWRCWAVSLVALLALGIGGCSEEPVTPPTPTSTMVTGTIESPDGNQLVEAVIEAVDANGTTVIASDTTDDLGSFALPEQVTASDVSLRVSHPEFPTQILGAATLVRNAGGRTGLRILMNADDSCCGIVTVFVRDDSTRAPLPNVQVRLRRGNSGGRTGTTNSDGLVVFRNVCDGEFNIRLARDGYTVVERGNLRMEHCDSVTTDPTMRRSSNGGGNSGGSDDTCCRGVFRIFPTDSNGNALNNVSIRLTRAGTNTARTLTSGDNRGAIFRELCRGTWNVRLARDGYGVVEFSITVGCNDSNSTDRVMRPNSGGNTGGGDDTCCRGVLRLLPLDSTGAILNGVSVRITRAGTTTTRSATTEGGRAVIFRELCQGTWNIRFARDGYTVIEYSITINCNDSLSSDRRMSRTGGNNTGGDDTCCRGIIRILPVDSNGTALNGVSVRIGRAGTNTTRTLTTEGGRAVIFREICQGTWNVRLARDGYGVVEYSITVNCNDSVSSDRRMNASTPNTCCTGVLRLRVRDSLPASGDGWLSGATVVLSEGNSVVASGTTNAEGAWGREGLCSGHTYTVRVTKDGYVAKTATYTFIECNTKQETIALRRE